MEVSEAPMIGSSISKLLALASAPLGAEPAGDLLRDIEGPGGIHQELANVLKVKNGFYAFEAALHVYPWKSSLSSVGLEDWNSPSGWRTDYGDLALGCLFFAEDVFGGQFCLKNGKVWQFDPETGDMNAMGASIEDWAGAVLQDFELFTGQPLARDWQKANGPLPAGMRLVPVTPFVMGGRFELANLSLMDAERSMRARGSIATQIRDLPDGSQVRLIAK